LIYALKKIFNKILSYRYIILKLRLY